LNTSETTGPQTTVVIIVSRGWRLEEHLPSTTRDLALIL
jgi:hypothetical protein